MLIFRTAGIFGDWGDIWLSIKEHMLNIYSGGIGDKVKPLLNAEQLTGNSSRLGRYVGWITGDNSLSSCRHFCLPELAVSMTLAAFHFKQYSLREPRLLPLLVFSIIRELIRATPLPACSVIAVLAEGVALFSSVMILVGLACAGGVGTTFAGAGAGLLAGALVLAGAGAVFSGTKV
jgi:hypothetical protein